MSTGRLPFPVPPMVPPAQSSGASPSSSSLPSDPAIIYSIPPSPAPSSPGVPISHTLSPSPAQTFPCQRTLFPGSSLESSSTRRSPDLPPTCHPFPTLPRNKSSFAHTYSPRQLFHTVPGLALWPIYTTPSQSKVTLLLHPRVEVPPSPSPLTCKRPLNLKDLSIRPPPLHPIAIYCLV